jgi:hypothetical protein
VFVFVLALGFRLGYQSELVSESELVLVWELAGNIQQMYLLPLKVSLEK